MSKIFAILKKNFKVLLNNKFSLFILFVAPLFIILILGFLFNNQNTYNINVGYYIPDSSNLSYVFLDNLKANNFKMIEFKSENKCLDSIKRGVCHICIFFPTNFDLNSSENIVDVKLDTTKENIVYIAQNILVDAFNDQAHVFISNNTQALTDVIAQNERDATMTKEYLDNLSLLITQLKEQNDKLSKQLVQLDFSFNPDSLKIDDISKRSDSIKESIERFASTGINTTTNVKTLLSNMTTLLSSIDGNDSAQMDEVKSMIFQARDDVQYLEIKINSIKSDYNIKSLNDKLDDLVDNVGKVSDNLEVLTTQMQDLNEKISAEYVQLGKIHSDLSLQNAKILSSISSIKIRDAQTISKPIEIKVDSFSDEQRAESHLSSLFPKLLVGLIFVIGIIISSNFILMEKESVGYFRNFLSKTNSIKFVLGNFFSLTLIVFMQILLIMFIYYILFLKAFTLQVLYMILLIFMIICVFILIGMFLGYLASNQATNVILSFFVILILFAFSGMMVPLEILPAGVVSMLMINPYLIAEGLIRKFVLFNGGFYDFSYEIIVLAIYLVTFFVLCLMAESINKKRMLYNYYSLFQISIKRKFKNLKAKIVGIFSKDKAQKTDNSSKDDKKGENKGKDKNKVKAKEEDNKQESKKQEEVHKKDKKEKSRKFFWLRNKDKHKKHNGK